MSSGVQPRSLPPSSEYDPISLRPSWSVLSIVFFVLAISAQEWLGWQPWRPRFAGRWPFYTHLATLTLATTGLMAGWIGRRRSAGSLARFGVLLNAVVALLTGLVLVVWVLILWRRF